MPDGTWQYTDTPTYGLNWVGTQSPRSAPVVVDTTAPTVPVPSVPAGYVTAPSVPVGLGTVTDAVSGVNAASVTVLRASAPLSAGTCGAFSSFAPVTLKGGNDTTVVPGRCYQYQQRATDNVGNTATSTTSTTVKVDSHRAQQPDTGLLRAHRRVLAGLRHHRVLQGRQLRRIHNHPRLLGRRERHRGLRVPRARQRLVAQPGRTASTARLGPGPVPVTATNGAGSTAATTLTARSDTDGPTVEH